MDYLKNRMLRWNVPLNMWLVFYLILSLVFYAISGFSTIIAVKTYGMGTEANPILRMLFGKIGLIPGMITIGTMGYSGIAALFFIPRKFIFLQLFIAHTVLIAFMLISLNDFSSIAPDNLKEIFSFAQIFGIYPWNIPFFLGLSFVLTLLTTKEMR